jgi:small conductance mechanosensitive channel
MTNASITNFSAKEQRRVDFKFTASYNDDVEKVKSILIEIAQNHPLVLKDPPIMSRLLAHGPNSLEYVLRVWCQAPDYWTIYFDINETVKKEFDAQGIEIPFSQMDVHIKEK